VPRRSDSERDQVTTLYRAIYAAIRRIPKGRVATYGQVAEVAGIPRGARVTAAALKVSGGQVAWQRVCAKAGPTHARIAILDPIGAAMQRAMLEAEGVTVGDAGRIDLATYGWRPWATGRAVTASRARGARPRPPPRSGSRTRASPSRR
jgi:methylated-DNA-protein-cysteine methyltransferase-like protein